MKKITLLIFVGLSLAAPLYADDNGTLSVAFGTSPPQEWIVDDMSSGWSQDKHTGQYQIVISAAPTDDPLAGIPLYGHIVLRLGFLLAAIPEELVVEGVPGKYVATIEDGALHFVVKGFGESGRTEGKILIEGGFSAMAPLSRSSSLARGRDPLRVVGSFSLTLGKIVSAK